MDSERDKAKRSIKQSSADDPELTDALLAGNQLKITIEENRHKEAMRTAELGWFGRVLGAESSAALTVAFIVVCFGMLTTIGCLVCAANAPTAADFWSKQAERSIAVTMTALSYIFGKSQKSGK